jgi:hypothetical protein
VTIGKKKRVREFDPHASLNELIAALAAQMPVEPGADCQRLIEQLREAFGEFERSVAVLHECGQTAAVKIIADDIERCMRRAVRLAREHGAAHAQKEIADGANH